MTGPSVRVAMDADAERAAEVFVEGSLDEAVFSWVIPDERARREWVATRREESVTWIAAAIEAGTVVLAEEPDGRVVGLTQWELVDPDESADPADDETEAFLTRIYGEHAPRMVHVLASTAARHPTDERHWYLQSAVVVPSHRSRGIGGAMLRSHLAEVDAAGLPSYLEASTPRNQALYERHGFEPVGERIVVADDGPRLQPMWRAARPRSR